MRSAKKYWQMKDDSVYPAVFSANRMVGDLWSTKADYRTWNGANVEYIHTNHMIPFTPITYDLLDYTYVKEEYPVLAKASATGEYLSYEIMVNAVLDPEKAWNRTQSETIEYFGANSRANMLWWIITRVVPRQSAFPACSVQGTTSLHPGIVWQTYHHCHTHYRPWWINDPE